MAILRKALVSITRAVRNRFGHLQIVREQYRQPGGGGMIEAVLQDVGFGLRMLCKDRGFTFVAVLTLALGIGANTSMFGMVNLLLFRPGPYPHSERLARIFRTSPHSQTWPHSAADLLDYREQNKSFERLAIYNWGGFNLAKPGEPAERVPGIFATADLFLTLGVPPMLGRVFTAAEEQPGHNVVVLGYNCWRAHFGADTNIVGRVVRMDGEGLTVIGVMPPNFDYSLLWGAVEAWRPLALTPEQRQNRGSHYLHAFGPLKPGVPMARAEAELKAICSRLPNTGPDSVRLVPLVRSGFSELGQRMLYFTFGLAGFVLLIACANLANLQLARSAGRWREFAVRAALGAGRSRLIRQLLTESVLVSALGGVFGLLVAALCNRVLSRRVEYLGVVPLDARVLAFAMLCSLATGILFGIAPAWMASRSDVNDALKDNHRGATAGRWQNLLRQGLTICQLALALALLSGAGLFIRKLQQLTRTDPGWRIDGLVSGQIALNSSKFEGANGEKVLNVFLRQLEERLAALPGAESVSLSWSLPVWGFSTSGDFSIEGQPAPKRGDSLLTYKESVTPDYFHTLGIKIQKGRGFTADDASGKPAVCVINQALARRFWPGENPLGRRIDSDGNREIVGVVDDVRFPGSLGIADTPYQLYHPLSQMPGRYLFITLRARGTNPSVLAGVRQVMAELDPDQPVFGVQTVRKTVDKALAGFATAGGLLAAFAILGLGLGAIGIYGVVSYAVSQRTSEFGLRLALGAQRGQVLWLVLRQGVFLCLAGTLLGLGGAAIIARLLIALLPELSTSDPMAFLLTTTLLAAVALLACYFPARRATKIDPMTALRYE